MTRATIDPRLQALLDKQEIYELVSAYCNAADRHDHEKLQVQHRAIVADWAHLHQPPIIDIAHPMMMDARIGAPGPADPSYGFFRLLRRGSS